MKLIPKIFRILTDGFFGKRCSICQCENLRDICEACEQQLKKLFARRAQGLSAFFFQYEESVARTVLNWKARGDEAGAQALIDWAIRRARESAAYQRYFENIDYIIPVAPDFKRTLQRGFHPPDLIARALSQFCGKPVLYRALKRISGDRQMGRAREERLVRGALFEMTRHKTNQALEGACILIVDDVTVTGSTLRAAQRALTNAAPQEIKSLALAKSI